MRKRNKLVYGVGINDADYVTQLKQTTGFCDGKQKQKLLKSCKIYQSWKDMLRRCYSPAFQQKYPSYKECTVCTEWLRFSNFKAWMDTQDWQGKHLDKDILLPGNKLYSPTTCVFVTQKVNKFLIDRKAARGLLPLGVYHAKRKDMVNELTKPYMSQLNNGQGKTRYLGMFSTPEEAHQAWLASKLELAKSLASEILDEGGDPRIAQALIDRYENYTINCT